MKDINIVIGELIDCKGFTQKQLAYLVGATESTVQRWYKESYLPRPNHENKIRKIYASLDQTIQTVEEVATAYQVSMFRDELKIFEEIDSVLTELRESLHRRGRISSRNEALDELTKLIFVHVVSPKGISKNTIRNFAPNDSIAKGLVDFSNSVIGSRLPNSLSYEIQNEDFKLKLKANEDILAEEIITIFEKLKLLRDINKVEVDVLNSIFGKFLADSFSNEKELGQYLTPTEVVRFMVKLAVNDLDEKEIATLFDIERCQNFGMILDPSCGVGTFLAEILRALHTEVKQNYTIADSEIWMEKMMRDVIVGVDKSERMIRLALTNLALFGWSDVNLFLANSLARTGQDANIMRRFEGKAKIILTNPPFGAEFKDKDLNFYSIGTESTKVNSELLFMERYLDWLAPGGQLLSIIPDSVLTNKGLYEKLRHYLADRVDLLNIISLPSVTFGEAGTTTKTSILHLRKRKATPYSYFAICKELGYTVKTSKSQRVKQSNGTGGLGAILDEIERLKTAETCIGRKVKMAEKARRWDAEFHATLSESVYARLDKPKDDDVLLRDVVSLIDERINPERFGRETFEYVEISDIDTETNLVSPKTIKTFDAPSRARKIARAHDILVSTVRPDRKNIGVVLPEQDGVICSTGLAVLRPKEVHPLVLIHLLKSEFVLNQINRHTLGIAYPAIDEDCLLDILLPISARELAALSPFGENLEAAEKQLITQRKIFGKQLFTAVDSWLETDLRHSKSHASSIVENQTPSPTSHTGF